MLGFALVEWDEVEPRKSRGRDPITTKTTYTQRKKKKEEKMIDNDNDEMSSVRKATHQSFSKFADYHSNIACIC